MAKKVSKEEMDEMINDQKEKRHYDEMSDEDKAKFDAKEEEIRQEYQEGYDKKDDNDNQDDDKKDDDDMVL